MLVLVVSLKPPLIREEEQGATDLLDMATMNR